MNKAEAALLYASWGWHVLPLLPNSKTPAVLHGVKEATINPNQIEAWWGQNPNFNIGIAAGKLSDIIVFDIDPRNGGEESWHLWQQYYGDAPGGASQITWSGGAHYLATYHPDVKSCKLIDGIDLLSDGKYFVAHPSDIEGKTYQWEASSDPLDGVAPITIPDKWLEAYRELRASKEAVQSTLGDNLIKGNRNNGLTALGGAMRRHGMTEAEIMAALAIANETRCEIPLPSSELSQIVRSVCRYEPESDIAASVGIGTVAAEAILAATKAETSEYYFTRATSYLAQPAPLKWVVKNWFPADGVCMVYGESGCGKTFLTLDMACHIAAGGDWNGNKTKSGLVVYMAGEGNYGLRQRIASWCKAYNLDSLDNLLISNKAIDVDGPDAATQIIHAVRELTHENTVAIFIDTVNNHMSGDENSAKDTRNMLNACNIIARALGASVCLNHHTGHSIDGKNRARGSSAWKASLDSSILVTKDNEGVVEVSCTKMKDAEHPKTFYGKIQPISLNWFDEDGEEIKGAIFSVVDENTVEKKEEYKESKVQKDIRKFSNAWFATGSELSESGFPYVSRNNLISYLMNNEGLSEATAKTYAQEGKKSSLIYNLLNSQIVVHYQDGWIVYNEAVAATLMIRCGKLDTE